MDTTVVTEDQVGKRLDAFMAAYSTKYSRSSWKKLIDQGYVLVDDQKANGKLKLKEDQKITINDIEKVDELDLPVIFEDDDVLVINKPSGVLTHLKGEIVNEATVAGFVAGKTTSSGGNRAGIVHRLDRATSGVMLAAKTEEARVYMTKQFANRQVKKWYLAAVKGIMQDDYYEIDKPIGRSYSNPSQFRIDPNGKPALTEVYVLNRQLSHSIVLLKPHTGRTHQLRVHLKNLGYPILGDPIYYPKYSANKTPNMLLHAWQLEATLPSNNHRDFVADLPAHMSEYFKDEDRDKAQTIIASQQYKPA